MKEKYAIVSVFDKTKIFELCQKIITKGYKIISTGGTAKLLKEKGLQIIEINEFTGDEEILQGRVKTLGRKIHAGILADQEKHEKEIKEQNIKNIKIVVCNFYPFQEKLKQGIEELKQGQKKEKEIIQEIIENIDIGGPTMTWSVIKNYDNNKLIVSEPKQYEEVIKELDEEEFKKDLIKKFSAKAALKTAQYRNDIANFLNSKFFLEEKFEQEMPKIFNKTFEKINYKFRYGENPHQQKSTGYKIKNQTSIFDVELLNKGKIPSYNNIGDMNSAINMIRDFFKEPFKNQRVDIIMKHGNPCGVGVGEKAFELACETDQISRFGGIYITKNELTMEDVQKIGKKYFEVIIAPGFQEGVVKELVNQDERRRIFNIKKILEKEEKNEILITSVIGGIIVQEKNTKTFESENFEIINQEKIKPEQLLASKLGFITSKHCNSNAVVLSKHNQVIGIGAGQMSRIDSVEIAIMKAKKAGLEIEGSVLASDAFFPKSDGPLLAINEGISGIIQTGGSKNDEEIKDFIKDKNIFMILTKIRHFKHSR